MTFFVRLFGSMLVALVLTSPLTSQPPSVERDEALLPEVLEPSTFDALKWRCAGSANMEGRITAIAVEERRPSTFYVLPDRKR